ncbi:serine hydrolase domain-containing protein [Kineococcus rubinsiae]|uniref:serine hydrolase domain-containing protein n=1 Tax=Kineococcus rubinsiae TaxID=2609562 RepID=UPI00143032EA|nr:serine hydrolase domain-containing protein [Kineococcus rubinsiae]
MAPPPADPRAPDAGGPDLAPLDGVPCTAVAGVSVAGRRRTAARGPVDGTSVFRVASLTKPVTAAATVRALDRAGVGLDTPVLDLLPGLAPDWRADRGITVAHLLSQTSGLAARVGAADVAALGDGPEVPLEAARLVARAGSACPPGRRWEYDNGNYFLAGAVLGALRGSTFEQAVRDLVLGPAGAAGAGFEAPADLVPGRDAGHQLPPLPYPRGRRPSGGLCAGVDDLLAVGEDLLADAALLARTSAPRTTPDDVVAYGLGWAVGPSGQLYLNGRLPGYRAALVLLPRHAVVGVVLTSETQALPAAAEVLSRLQQQFTGDEIGPLVDAFAA